MKKFLRLFCFSSILLFFGINLTHAQLTFDNGLTAQQLAEIIAGPGITVTNATINCDPNAIGSFSGASNMGIPNGIILTTGNTMEVSPNTGAPDAGICTNHPAGDSQLDALFGTTTCDACALEFDITPICDTIAFNYCFGSDEYPEYVCSIYNDAFAFFISGPGVPLQNIALIPGTSIPVAINTVNNGTSGSESGGGTCTSLAYSQYYVNNTGTTIEYDGFTTVLKASIPVQACQTYHMKMVIGDGGSGITATDCLGFDSGVFIEGGGLHCSSLSASATVQNAIEGCQNGEFQFCRPASTASPLTIFYTIAGTAINGIDYNTINDSIIIPAGQLCVTLPIIPISDGLVELTDSILIIYQPGSCPVMDTIVIKISDNPPVNAGPDITFCSGGNATIGISSVVGTTYSWIPVTGLSSSTSSNPSVTLTNSGTSPVTTNYILTATTNGCVSSDTVAVTVNPIPTANAGSSKSVCAGSSITLAGSFGGSATSGVWSGGSGAYSPNSTTLNAIYTPSAAEYIAGSVTLTLTANGLCPVSSSNVTFYFYQNPVINYIVDDPAGCPVHCVNFTDQSLVGGGDNVVAWTWDFGDGSTANQQNPSHCYSQTGFYDVSLTATSNHLCSSSATTNQMIQVYAIPVAAFNPTPNPAAIFAPNVTLNNQSSADVTYWNWDFGDGATLSGIASSPTHAYPNDFASSYIATLIVHNADDCYDTVSHEIVINPEFTFFIPNAFTPNADGVNDYFFGSGLGIIDYDLWILDRWGNMIFHGKDLNDKWDGKANDGAEMAQQDVYVWKVKLTDVFGKKHNYIGTVTLVK